MREAGEDLRRATEQGGEESAAAAQHATRLADLRTRLEASEAAEEETRGKLKVAKRQVPRSFLTIRPQHSYLTHRIHY